MVLWRRGGFSSLPSGLVAGSVAGVVGSATLACVVLLGDVVPHWFAERMLSGGGFGALLVWILMVLVWWAVLGGLVALVLRLVPPLKAAVLDPLLGYLGGICRLCGLRGLAAACESSG
jgi:hypothetical protein